MKESDLKAAHKHCSNNRKELENSTLCGCFYCESIYEPSLIVGWVDNEVNGFCYYCGIDSVIGDASGYTIDKKFLDAMHRHYFSTDMKNSL